MTTNETPAEAAGALSPGATIAEKIDWLETCHTALDDRAIAVFNEVFATIMRTHDRWVWRRILKWGVPENLAKELSQEVFAALIRRVKHHGVKGGFRKLIGKITKGKLLNFKRDEDLAPKTECIPSSGSAPAESAVDVDRAIDLRELAQRSRDELSPDHRAVVQKAILEDLSDEEAAAQLGLPVGTMKSRLRAAIAVLRALETERLTPSERNVA